MVWKRIKSFFGGSGNGDSDGSRGSSDGDDGQPDIAWVEAADNPWGVRVLDVRPVTHHLLSTSSDPTCATNAVSFGQEDGTVFIGELPPESRTVAASLRFPIDRFLANGVLFIPMQMEHKWALFCHGDTLICVRSWRRRVQLTATLRAHPDHVEITQVHGTFGEDDEPAEFTIRMLDYLLRSHALDLAYPAPLLPDRAADPKAAALWCMSVFGNRAAFATPHRFERRDPERPLRSHSLLHIAVARGDVAGIERSLAAGIPIDVLAGDGLAPLHWALASADPGILGLLLDRGASVDARSAQGATPLMNAVQASNLAKVNLLLDRGADVDARDHRGFTALHRAAEMGLLDVVNALLDRGAAPDPDAAGHTPRSFAQARGHHEVLAALDASSGKIAGRHSP